MDYWRISGFKRYTVLTEQIQFLYMLLSKFYFYTETSNKSFQIALNFRLKFR